MKVFEKLNINPTNINLYYAAFTHTSFSNENPSFTSYERLEFLGDAVLELIISDYLYKERHLEEGLMTKMRACYVCELALATYAKELKFDEEIRLGSGDVTANNTIMADVFEAFMGALYLDQGLEVVKKVAMDIMIKYIEREENFLKDYKSEFQELVQTNKKSAVYEVIDEMGPPHNKTFTCQVKVGNKIMGKGIGNSKKNAEQEAARVALEKMTK